MRKGDDHPELKDWNAHGHHFKRSSLSLLLLLCSFNRRENGSCSEEKHSAPRQSMTWLTLSPFLPTSQLWWLSVNLERRKLCSPGAQDGSHVRTRWDISEFRGFRCLCVSLPQPWEVNSTQHLLSLLTHMLPKQEMYKTKARDWNTDILVNNSISVLPLLNIGQSSALPQLISPPFTHSFFKEYAS